MPGLVTIRLNDSKRLTKRQRETSAQWIYQNAVAVGLGWVEPTEIDALGLTESVRLAFSRALAELTAEYDELILDGNVNYFPNDPRARAVVRADASVPCVSAASIVAKVARDVFMTQLGERYAGYGFEKHVGYGTAAHIAALRKLGVSDIHRRSYRPVKALLA